MRRERKCTWQVYKTKEDILPKFEIKKILILKIQNYRSKWVQQGRLMDRDRLPHLFT
jgi:hypothetical protein